MVNDDNDYKLNIYKIDTRTKLDKKRIFIMVILILLLFCILLTINHIKNVMEEYKVYQAHWNGDTDTQRLFIFLQLYHY